MENRMFTGKIIAGAAIVGICGVAHTSLALAEGHSLERVQEPNLKAYTVVNGEAIPKPFTDKQGNAKRGKAIFVHRKKGNCLTCHTAPIPEEEFHGQVAPDLAGVGDRLSAGEIRLRLVDPKRLNPDTPMMSFYRTHGLNQVKKSFVGKPMLNEQELEDVIAYLMTLK